MSDFRYETFKRDTLATLKGIGQEITPSGAERLMISAQVKRRRGVNFMTDDIWQYRKLAKGSLIAEISYGWFMSKPLLGLTVYCVGDLSADAPEWDHSLSGSFNSIADLAGRLAELEAGGRERIAALAQENAS